MEYENKKLLENADENRKQQIEKITAKIEEIESIIEDIDSEDNKIISKCIKEAQKHDVSYTPDRNILKDFMKLKVDLNIILEKLQSLSLTEDKIFEEDKYLLGAETILEKIDAVIGEKQREFRKGNEEQLDQNFDRKIEIDIALSNTKIELAYVNSDIEDIESQNAERKSRISYKIGLFNRKNNNEIRKNDDKLSELYAKRRKLESKISTLEIRAKVEHFVPIPSGQDDGKKTEKEDKELSKE